MGGIHDHAVTELTDPKEGPHVGDEVFVSTPDGLALKYVVREIHPRVAPEDTSWIDPTPTERLTLQTSTGPSRSDPRFVVIATPA